MASTEATQKMPDADMEDPEVASREGVSTEGYTVGTGRSL